MNTRNMNILGLCMLIVSLAFTWTGTSFELSKSVQESFTLKADQKLEISNKYGQVDIKTWDKQEAKFDILITIKARNEKKAKEIIDQVNIDFSESGDKVRAETTFGEDSNNNWSWSWGDVTNVSYEINYTVYMPKNAYLSVANKYGKTMIPELNRDISLEIKYGDLEVADQTKNVNLQLGYGEAVFGNMNNFNCDIKYSEIVINNAADLKVDSKYSDHRYGKIQNLTLDSGYDDFVIESLSRLKNSGKYDDFKIGTANEILFDSKYSDIEIKNLLDKGAFYTKYGDIEIGNLGERASEVRFDINYSDFIVRKVNSGIQFDIEADYSDIILPNGTEYTLNDRDGNSLHKKGHSSNAQTIIRGVSRYGDVIIRD